MGLLLFRCVVQKNLVGSLKILMSMGLKRSSRGVGVIASHNPVAFSNSSNGINAIELKQIDLTKITMNLSAQ